MALMLGKKPAREQAVSFRFARYFDKDALPKPPLRFGHFGRVKEWGQLGNDNWGDCVWAGGAHETMLWHAANRRDVLFDEKSVLADYRDATGFNHTRETDNGTDMQQAASYRRTTGIVDAQGKRHKIEAYVAIAPGDVDTLMLACYLFGAVGIGIQFPILAEHQFKYAQPWDVGPPSRLDGGHYIPVVGRNSAGNILCVTWGRLHAMTPKFFQAYNDETVVYLSKEWIDDNMFSPDGFDYKALQRDLASL